MKITHLQRKGSFPQTKNAKIFPTGLRKDPQRGITVSSERSGYQGDRAYGGPTDSDLRRKNKVGKKRQEFSSFRSSPGGGSQEPRRRGRERWIRFRPCRSRRPQSHQSARQAVRAHGLLCRTRLSEEVRRRSGDRLSAQSDETAGDRVGRHPNRNGPAACRYQVIDRRIFFTTRVRGPA